MVTGLPILPDNIHMKRKICILFKALLSSLHVNCKLNLLLNNPLLFYISHSYCIQSCLPSIFSIKLHMFALTIDFCWPFCALMLYWTFVFVREVLSWFSWLFQIICISDYFISSFSVIIFLTHFFHLVVLTRTLRTMLKNNGDSEHF